MSLTGIVGRNLSPPEHAIVLGVDEQSHIQALNRIQKDLPLSLRRLGTTPHDDKPNGTTTLFAALNVANGTALVDVKSKHCRLEWLGFRRPIEATYPEDDLRMLWDNDANHKHEKIRRRLKRRSRFHIHFTPTVCS